MLIKAIVDEDFVNFKQISMYIITPFCDFKCDKENGNQWCQNAPLVAEPNLDIPIESIIRRFDNNPLSDAIVFGGLEPFKSPELEEFISTFRARHSNLIVIYTGYTEQEVQESYNWILNYSNIIIKYGRFRPNQEPHLDNLLGVKLASDNQYAKLYNEV